MTKVAPVLYAILTLSLHQNFQIIEVSGEVYKLQKPWYNYPGQAIRCLRTLTEQMMPTPNMED